VAATERTNGHVLGPNAFVHLDVASAFSRLQSPTTPQDYALALIQQFPLNEQSASHPRPALALCDWGLHSAVKMAVACARAGIDHLPGLRLRVVPEASKRTFFSSPERVAVT
jgi:DNA polymerase III alpha subunit